MRVKWACTDSEAIPRVAVPAQVINKGILTSGLLAQVLIAKFSDYQPLYRQEHIIVRARLAIAHSTLSNWVGRFGVALQPLVDAMRDALLRESVLHEDEMPMLMPEPTRHIFWPMTARHFLNYRRQCIISHQVMQTLMPVLFSMPGKASWPVKTTMVTKQVLSRRLSKLAVRYMHGENFSTCIRRTKAK